MEPDEVLSNYAEAWGELKDLAATRGWEYFTDRLTYEMGLHQARVLGGKLDAATYQFECGVVRGLQLALTVPQRVKDEYDQRLNLEAEEVASQNGQMEMIG
jgi:hypothetical protein